MPGLQVGLDDVALHVGDGELIDLELLAKGKLGNLFHAGKLVLVPRDPLQHVLDELVLLVNGGDGELEVAEDDLALQEEHLALETVPLVRSCSGRPWW